MIELFSYFLTLLICGYVIAPLLKKTDVKFVRTQEGPDIGESLYQKRFILDTLNDMKLDKQMGKISSQDYEELIKEQEKMLNDVENHLKNMSGVNINEMNEHLEKEIEQVKQTSGIPKCPQCGHKRKPTDKFCSNCGLNLKNDQKKYDKK